MCIHQSRVTAEASQSEKLREWDGIFLRVVDERTNVASSYENQWVSVHQHRAQEIDQETALQTSQDEETDRIPFTLTYHPQNLTIKNVIPKNFAAMIPKLN